LCGGGDGWKVVVVMDGKWWQWLRDGDCRNGGGGGHGWKVAVATVVVAVVVASVVR